MRPSSMRQWSMAAVAGGLLLFSGTGPITFGDDDTGPRYDAYLKQADGLGGVTLLNTGRQQQSGTVVAEVMIDGKAMLFLERFAVSGGNKVFVSWGLLDPLMYIIRVGIIVDDGVPF